MRFKLGRTVPVFLALLTGVLIGAFWPRDDDFFAIRKSFEIYGGVYEELVAGYVDRIDPERLMRTGIDAMLGELDPFTVFFDEADNADMEIITRGSYGGVGLNVGIRNGRITVIAPIEGASGYKQGVRAGDVIIRIEERATIDLTLSDVQKLLRGEPGTAVEIQVEREGTAEPIVFVLPREEVRLHNVSYAGRLPGTDVGYVRLDRFANGAGAEVRAALTNLTGDGTLSGLILDLRDNPGGLLDAAVEISELFLPRGSEIVSTNGRLPETKRVYKSGHSPLLPDTPLVILVNNLSASASEIVAGAVQDLDRGVVAGVPTFGKGLVQIVRELPYNTSLKLTTSRYFLPSGRSIQAATYGSARVTTPPTSSTSETYQSAGGRVLRSGQGIEPDIRVETEPSPLESALRRKAAFFFFANHFAATRDSVSIDFTPDDQTVISFRKWLADRDFTFETPAEVLLHQLETSLADSDVRDAGDELTLLRQAIQQEKQAGFDRNEERLREALRAEIVARFHGESAQIRSTFATDPLVIEAARILRDDKRYSNILGRD